MRSPRDVALFRRPLFWFLAAGRPRWPFATYRIGNLSGHATDDVTPQTYPLVPPRGDSASSYPTCVIDARAWTEIALCPSDRIARCSTRSAALYLLPLIVIQEGLHGPIAFTALYLTHERQS